MFVGFVLVGVNFWVFVVVVVVDVLVGCFVGVVLFGWND